MDTTSIILSLTLFIFIGIPLILFFNQIGRALVGSLFTNENIELYFGSLPTSEEESFKVKISRFKFFFVKNYFWFQGSCRFLDTRFLSVQKKIIQVGSTFITFLISLGFYYLTDEYNFPQIIKVATVFFFGTSCLNVMFSLTQQNEFIEDTIGTTIKNYIYSETDTEQLSDIEELTNLYQQGIDYYNQENYKEAAILLQKVVNKSVNTVDMIVYIYNAYSYCKEYKKAEKFISFLYKKLDEDTHLYNNFGLMKSYVNKNKESLFYYDKSIKLDSNNADAINNRGYTYNLLNQYEKAILDFDEAIRLQPKEAYPHNNRGLAKIKLGKIEEGLKDIQISMKLDDENSYAYKNLGIYHFDKKEYKTALENFEKSYQLDKETHLIGEHIRETKDILKKLEEN